MFVLGGKADIVAEHSQNKQAVWIGTNALIFSLFLCDQSECSPRVSQRGFEPPQTIKPARVNVEAQGGLSFGWRH